MVNQLSVFLENTTGRLSQVTHVLSDNNIDLLALTIADTTNFGIMRTIVNDEEKAVKALKEDGYTVNLSPVIVVVVEDHPGGLTQVLDILQNAQIGIEYLYSFVNKPKESALIVFKVDDVEGALDILKKENIPMLAKKDLETAL
ncbi:MAG: ACT domain-containing protein [Eubacteriales bacterium]